MDTLSVLTCACAIDSPHPTPAGRRKSLRGDTLPLCCASFRSPRKSCSPLAPSGSPWTFPCSLFPVSQRMSHSRLFHSKYRMMNTLPFPYFLLHPPAKSVPPGSERASERDSEIERESVCVCMFALGPFFASRLACRLCTFTHGGLTLLWCQKAQFLYAVSSWPACTQMKCLYCILPLKCPSVPCYFISLNSIDFL